MNEPLTPDDIAKKNKREFDNTESFFQYLQERRYLAHRYYEAMPFGNEADGMSQIVLPDVQTACDFMGQSVMRTFVSGERTVEFEATDEVDEEIVDQATAAINFNFMREQDGYRILLDGLNDGLRSKTGIFKTCVEMEEEVSYETVTADPLAVEMLALESGMDADDVRENIDGTLTARFKSVRIVKKFRDYAIPPHEFRFNSTARNEDDAYYLCHAKPTSRSDVVALGADPEQVDRLPTYSRQFEEEERKTDRHKHINFFEQEASRENERVLLCEEYSMLDIDGDGIAERVKCFRVENELLIDAETGEPMVELVDDHPFSVFCPYPEPHAMVGYSLAEKVMDIQLARSKVARQMMDGMAFSNMPRMVIDMARIGEDGEQTIDDVLSPIPGSPIRARGGAASVAPLPNNFNIGTSLQALEWITGEGESRTQITRMNQGLDHDAINKTATGAQIMHSQGQLSEEFVARNLAEALSRLFRKKYRLMRKEGDVMRVKVDGQYMQVDPKMWPEHINVNVRVGLGSGSKDKRVQARMLMGQVMDRASELGLVQPEHVFNLADGLARDMDIGQGADYMEDPNSPEAQMQEEGPDPELEAARMEYEYKWREKQAELQIRFMEMQGKLQLEAQKQGVQLDLQVQKAEFEAMLAEQKAAWEAANKANLTDNRAGGSLAA